MDNTFIHYFAIVNILYLAVGVIRRFGMKYSYLALPDTVILIYPILCVWSNEQSNISAGLSVLLLLFIAIVPYALNGALRNAIWIGNLKRTKHLFLLKLFIFPEPDTFMLYKTISKLQSHGVEFPFFQISSSIGISLNLFLLFIKGEYISTNKLDESIMTSVSVDPEKLSAQCMEYISSRILSNTMKMNEAFSFIGFLLKVHQEEKAFTLLKISSDIVFPEERTPENKELRQLFYEKCACFLAYIGDQKLLKELLDSNKINPAILPTGWTDFLMKKCSSRHSFSEKTEHAFYHFFRKVYPGVDSLVEEPIEKSTLNIKKEYLIKSMVILFWMYHLFIEYGYSTDSSFFLVKWGAYSTTLVNAGEYYRLFTCAFLHSGYLHILMNTMFILSLGTLVESLFSGPVFMLIYTVSVVSASGLKHLFSPGISVGASGGLMGIFGSLLALKLIFFSPRLKQACSRAFKGPLKISFQNSIESINRVDTFSLLFSLGAIAFLGIVETRVDSLGHLGGFLSGFFITFIILLIPRFKLWKIFGIVCLFINLAFFTTALYNGLTSQNPFDKIEKQYNSIDGFSVFLPTSWDQVESKMIFSDKLACVLSITFVDALVNQKFFNEYIQSSKEYLISQKGMTLSGVKTGRLKSNNKVFYSVWDFSGKRSIVYITPMNQDNTGPGVVFTFYFQDLMVSDYYQKIMEDCVIKSGPFLKLKN